ncbi:unnamed protein product [Psylliodes chrysocephalus]|uniref:RNA-binding protein 8A n=1 Tax=Psylliodes chrysocephalus TaxID=3402493 RepID=A0A9P0GF93_9CUCU|nr:unnamed protein product [Psylliodes chrysocephala]
MADVLDINDAVDIDVEDEGEQSVLRLKDKVVSRKGRGFGPGEGRQHEKIRGYESIEAGDRDHGDEPGPQKSVEGWILFVTSVHEEATEEDLSKKFSEYGTIKNISINLDRRTGFLKGYALIEYGSYGEASVAREALNGSSLLGQTVGVDWCFVKGPKKTKKRSKRH